MGESLKENHFTEIETVQLNGGSIIWLTSQALSLFTCSAGEAMELRQLQRIALHIWVEMCGLRAAAGLDVTDNSVAEQCFGRDPNLLHSPWASSQLSLVRKQHNNCLKLFAFSSFHFLTLSGAFFPRIFLNWPLDFAPFWMFQALLCVFNLTWSCSFRGLHRNYPTQHLGHQNPESWLWQPGIIRVECVIIAITFLFWF